MRRPLVFPDGVRLAREEDLPGPEAKRAEAWARIQAANIETGFTLVKSTDTQFAFYAEANVDASKTWLVFRDLCSALLGSEASLVMGESDDEPTSLGSAPTLKLLAALEPHQYRLAHDGYIQFGLIYQDKDRVMEVFVAPTKHFKVWLNDEQRFRATLQVHGVPEMERLEFLDEYPRVTKALFQDAEEFIEQLREQIQLQP